MAPGRPGRIPRLIEIIKTAGAPLTVAQITTRWNNKYPNDVTSNKNMVVSLRRAAVNSRTTSIVRVKTGVYEYDADALGPVIRTYTSPPTPRVREIQETIKQWRNAAADLVAVAETDRTIAKENDAEASVTYPRGGFDILHTLPDGRILLRENWAGTVWIAKEI